MSAIKSKGTFFYDQNKMSFYLITHPELSCLVIFSFLLIYFLMFFNGIVVSYRYAAEKLL